MTVGEAIKVLVNEIRQLRGEVLGRDNVTNEALDTLDKPEDKQEDKPEDKRTK